MACDRQSQLLCLLLPLFLVCWGLAGGVAAESEGASEIHQSQNGEEEQGMYLPHEDDEETTPLHSAMKSFTLDKMGPAVVNEDGTMSRIPNWSELTMGEKEKAIRMVTQRNHKRMEAIKARQEHASERMWAGSPAQRAPHPSDHDEL